MEDAEDVWARANQRFKHRSSEQEMVMILKLYKQAIMFEPWKSQWDIADGLCWELHLMQRKEAKDWGRREKHEKLVLRMALRWLRRVGLQRIEYEEITESMKEDIAALLFLRTSEGLQMAYPTLSAEVFY